MNRRGLLNFLGRTPGALGWLGAVSSAASAGKSLEALLEITAQNLLSAGRGDRAGVWIQHDAQGRGWQGLVVDAHSSRVPEQWLHLESVGLLPKGLLEGRGPVVSNLHAVSARPPVGPLTGMQTALWLPLRDGASVIGVALVASAWPRAPANSEILTVLASDLALAVAERRTHRLLDQAQAELHSHAEISRVIHRGGPIRPMLESVAAAAARHTGAQFVAVARLRDEKLHWVSFAGPPESSSLLEHSSVLEATHTATEQSRAVLTRLDVSAGQHATKWLPGLSPVSSVVAFPLTALEDSLGVLLAGYAREGDGAAERLEPYAALASSALSREYSRAGITERDAAFLALFESGAEALMILSCQGVVQHANRRARELLRLKDEHLGQIRLGDLFSAPARESLAVWLARATAGERPEPHDAAVETGFVVRLSLRSRLEREGQLWLCLEEGSLTQRSEQRWKQAEAELRSVLDAVEAGVLLLDLQGRIRFVNSRYAQLFGLDARSLAALKEFDELVPLVQDRFRDPKAFAERWRDLAGRADESGHEELEIVRPARKFFERFSRPVLDGEGRRLGWLEVYRDITGQRHIQSKLLQTEKMAALGQLVSGIAHELNNPLTAMMGYAQLLLGHGLRPAQLAEAKKIYQEAERARRIVKNLLFFAREAKPERTRVDLNEIVERTLALRAYELRVENISVEAELDRNLPVTLADPYQLQQVMLNLLVNAEQALLQGRGHGRIWIRTHSLSSDRLAIEVADDGPGVPPEFASRIFDPFFTTKPPGVGTGLGLSIVYGIVQQHGGEVYMESPRGEGARFVVELPLVTVPAVEAKPEAPPAQVATSSITGRILVVEDEPTVAQLITDVLREEGHQVDAVLDSQEGLTRISRSRYDLIICDLRMPRLDGPAFYDALVRSGSPVQHRILFTTGDTLATRTQEFLEGYDLPCLSKPFLVEELKLAVNRMLERNRPEQGLAATSPAPNSRPEAIRRQ